MFIINEFISIVSLVLLAVTPPRSASPATDAVFGTAVAARQMRDRKDARVGNELRVVGAVVIGEGLAGHDRLDGGYLDAGQGTGGDLNLSGNAINVSVRLWSPSGSWDAPLFSKHGGHDRLVFQLYASATALGFELETRDTPGRCEPATPRLA